jgi:signal transduction histidine kinase
MGIEERYRFLAFAFTAAGHALVLVLFLLGGSHVGQAWPLQLGLLLAASLALSATTFALRGKRYARLCFAPKLLVLALFSDVALGMAGGGALFVEMEGAFIGIAIVEISLYFKLAASLSLDALALAVSLCAAVATSAVDPSFPRLAPEMIALVSAAALAASIVANALRAAVARLGEALAEGERLDKAVSQLIDANIGFQRVATAAGEDSADRERKRVSRDIHDTAVHSLVNIIMLAESIHDKIRPDQGEIVEMLGTIIAQAKDAVRDTRQSLRELRDIGEERPRGLRAVHRLARVFSEATGVRVDLHYGNLPWEISPEIDEAIYRMIQEGMTNAFRHGKATTIKVGLWISPAEPWPEIIVSLADNGEGAQDIEKGIGLSGMEERIRRVEGILSAGNISGGFEVRARIPLKGGGQGE